MIAGWASNALAQADLKVDYIQGSEDSLNSLRNTSNNRVMADPPANYTTPIKLVYNNDIYSELRERFGYKADNQIKLVEYKNIKEDVPVSNFQLIVDEEGNVIDCALLESSNADRDNTVLNYLPEKKFYTETPLFNGEPCKTVVILSFCHSKNGSSAYIKDSYPLLPLPDTKKDAASTNPSSDK